VDKSERNKQLLTLVADYIAGLLTDSEWVLRTTDVMREYNKTLPARLAYEPCNCSARNHAALPGQVGRLYAVVQGEYHFIRNCPYCGG